MKGGTMRDYDEQIAKIRAGVEAGGVRRWVARKRADRLSMKLARMPLGHRGGLPLQRLWRRKTTWLVKDAATCRELFRCRPADLASEEDAVIAVYRNGNAPVAVDDVTDESSPRPLGIFSLEGPWGEQRLVFEPIEYMTLEGILARAVGAGALARVTSSREQQQGMTTEEQQDNGLVGVGNVGNSVSRDAEPIDDAKSVVAGRDPTRPSDAERSEGLRRVDGLRPPPMPEGTLCARCGSPDPTDGPLSSGLFVCRDCGETLRRALDGLRRPAMPEGTLCACCGSPDIDPTTGSLGSGLFLCRDCGGLLMHADFEVDGRWVGETVLDCPVHGSKTLGSS